MNKTDKYIDFHCHLDYKDFNGERCDAVNECFEAGFSAIVTLADPYEDGSYERTAEAVGCHSNVYCMAGAHPHNAEMYSDEIEKGILNFIDTHYKKDSKDNRLIGFGEVGLDFHYNLSEPGTQREVFRRQICLAKELQLPLVIHSRKAEQEVINILEEEKFDRDVVFHCYTGNMEDAEEIVKRGYYISISGIVTFKNAQYLRDIAAMIPLDKIFTETDSPYLSPVPYRGKTNRPLRVMLVAEQIAQVKGIDVKELNNAVNENFIRLFSL